MAFKMSHNIGMELLCVDMENWARARRVILHSVGLL